MENETIKMRHDLFKKVSECQRLLDILENMMNASPENQKNYESLWGRVYNFQKEYIRMIDNVDELDKLSAEVYKLYNENNKTVVEEVSNEVEPIKEEIETPIQEGINEIVETPVEESIENEVQEEIPQVELPQVEETAPVEEAKVEPVEIQQEEVVNTPVEETVENEVQEEMPQVELPQVEETASVEEAKVEPVEIQQEKVVETPAEVTGETKVEDVSEPSQELVPQEEVTSLSDVQVSKQVFVNESEIDTPGKKISVNERQKTKLAASLKDNKEKLTELFGAPVETTEEKKELSPEEQIDVMLKQQKELYNNGELEKAEAMAKDISVLTKKISESAA